MTDNYRSYVVRVRRRKQQPDSTRLDVEDLLGGRRGIVMGDAARDLADDLEALVGEPPASSVLEPSPDPPRS